jgi:hypothetical protein
MWKSFNASSFYFFCLLFLSGEIAYVLSDSDKSFVNLVPANQQEFLRELL